ncbi:MAG: hypothetical protein AAGC90_13950 [Curtobacterium sp.]
MSTGTDTIALIGGLIVGAIIVSWLVATDHARRNSVARAWLTASQHVDAELTPPATALRRHRA